MDYMRILHNTISQNIKRAKNEDAKKEKGTSAEGNQTNLSQAKTDANQTDSFNFVTKEEKVEEQITKAEEEVAEAKAAEANNNVQNIIINNFLKNIKKLDKAPETFVEAKAPVEEEVAMDVVAEDFVVAEETADDNLFNITSLGLVGSSADATMEDTDIDVSSNNIFTESSSFVSYDKITEDTTYVSFDANGNIINNTYENNDKVIYDKDGKIIIDDSQPIYLDPIETQPVVIEDPSPEEPIGIEDPNPDIIIDDPVEKYTISTEVSDYNSSVDFIKNYLGYSTTNMDAATIQYDSVSRIIYFEEAHGWDTRHQTYDNFSIEYSDNGNMKVTQKNGDDVIKTTEYELDTSIVIEEPIGPDEPDVPEEPISPDPIPGPISMPWTTTVETLEDGSTIEKTSYDDGSWSKISRDADGNITGREGVVLVDAGDKMSGNFGKINSNWLPVNVEISNPTGETAQVSYSIDADGNVTVNADGLEFNAMKEYLNIICLDGADVDPEAGVFEVPLNNITFVGDNNTITGSDKNDNITVKGNNNKVDLRAGDDEATVKGNSNKVDFGEGEDIGTIQGKYNDISNVEDVLVSDIGLEPGEKGTIEWVNKLLGEDLQIANAKYDDNGRITSFEVPTIIDIDRPIMPNGTAFYTIDYSDWGTDINSTQDLWTGNTMSTTKSFDTDGNCYYERYLEKNGDGNVVSSRYVSGGWEGTTNNTYNESGMLTSSVSQNFADGELVSTYTSNFEYDANGNNTRSEYADFDANGAQTSRYLSEMTYFDNGNMATNVCTNWGGEDNLLSQSIYENYENGYMKTSTSLVFDNGVQTSMTVNQYSEDGEFVSRTGEKTIQAGSTARVQGVRLENNSGEAQTINFTYTADGHLELNADNMDISPSYKNIYFINETTDVDVVANDFALTDGNLDAVSNEEIEAENFDKGGYLMPYLPIYEPTMENMTINGNNNNIKGGEGNDNISVKGNNNVIDLAGGEDTLNIVGNNNRIKHVENVNTGTAKTVDLDNIGIVELFTILGGAEGKATELLQNADWGSGAGGGQWDNEYLISAADLKEAFVKYPEDSAEGKIVRLFYDGNKTTELFDNIAQLGWAWGGTSNDYIDFGELVGVGFDRSTINTGTVSYDTMKAKLESLAKPTVGSEKWLENLWGEDLEIANAQYDSDGKLVSFDLAGEWADGAPSFTIDYWNYDDSNNAWITKTEFDPTTGGKLVSEKFIRNDEVTQSSETQYRNDGQVLSSHTWVTGGWETFTNASYNGDLLESTTSEHYQNGELINIYKDSYSYDEQGRNTRLECYGYDAAGNGGLNCVYETGYDENGNVNYHSDTNFYENGQVSYSREKTLVDGVEQTDMITGYDENGNVNYTVVDNFPGDDLPNVRSWGITEATIYFEEQVSSDGSYYSCPSINVSTGQNAVINADGTVEVTNADGLSGSVYNKDGSISFTFETTTFEDGSWSKVTTYADGSVAQEGMKKLAGKTDVRGELPLGVEIFNPNEETTEITYSIDANGNATVNANNVEISSLEPEQKYDYDITKGQCNIWLGDIDFSLNNITFVGDNNKITGSSQNDNIVVMGNNNLVDLGDGDDKVYAEGGNVGILGGDGDDTIYADSEGDVIVYSGNGDDNVMVRADGSVKVNSGYVEKTYSDDGTIQITESNQRADGNNSIQVSANGDVLVQTGDGDNDIAVAGGDVYVQTGAGKDIITVAADNYAKVDAGAGDDDVLASAGIDAVVYAGEGDDKVYMQTGGIAYAEGNDGNDEVFVDAGIAQIDLGVGNDIAEVVSSDTGIVLGDNGDKNIKLVAGSDAYVDTGDFGNDNIEITAGGGAQVVTGGDNDNVSIVANDVAYVDAGDGNDNVKAELYGAEINAKFNGGDGEDSLDVTITNPDSVVNFDTDFENVAVAQVSIAPTPDPEYDIIVDAAAGEELFSIEADEADSKTFAVNMPDGSIETFQLDLVADSKVSISMDEQGRFIFDGDGYSITDLDNNNDNWIIKGNNVKVNTAGGDDCISFEGGDANITGGDGNDTILAQSNGHVSVDAGNGDDYVAVKTEDSSCINGGDGNNFIQAESVGYTDVTTGNGDDYIQVKANDSVINTGDGNNTVDITTHSWVELNSGAGNDNLTINAGRSVNLNAGAGNDNVSVTANGNTYVNAGAGDDNIQAEIIGDNKTATFVGGDGYDKLDATIDGDDIFIDCGDSTMEEVSVTGTPDTILQVGDGDVDIDVIAKDED